MTRRPKDIGTAYATSVTRWLQANGWADAERLPQYGNRDRGDLMICRSPIVVAECKAGNAAEVASPAVIDEWLDECFVERNNAAAVLCPLIVYRYRRPLANNDVWLPLSHLTWLDTGTFGGSGIPVRMSLADFSDLLRTAVGR